MEKRLFPSILKEIVERDVPDQVDLWPDIRARVDATRQSPRGNKRVSQWWVVHRPVPRWGWAFPTLIVLLLLSATVYAISPFINQVFHLVPSWQYLEQENLLHDIQLSQTAGGVTVTLEKVYADAHQILIGYSVSGSPDASLHNSEATLTDINGIVFREVAGAGVTGTSEILNVSLPEGAGSYVKAFDAAAVRGAPDHLQLHLSLQLTQQQALAASEAELSTTDGRSVEPAAVVEVLTPETWAQETTAGLFDFDFDVPFIPARTAYVQQSAQAAGISMRLQEIAIAPSETRVTFCFLPPAGMNNLDWAVTGALRPGFGRTYHLAFEDRGRVEQTNGEQCATYGLLAPLDDHQGTWTLRVNELVGFEQKAPYGQTRLSGPWVFRYQAP